ncbi:guanylate kinase [Bombilactobacillus bombi]|uniref:guanylate kinase n=1 Tax=Bombilactobacillus bombi TaxID=1303590 RepID=UPI0015E5EC93|nr:AAA family ATPase [Bombilactobacillus bombi]MBA1433992.1 guanylate kinase [Bombilactobacillus bombi]
MKKIIVLTGASGVGKTTVSHYLQQHYGITPIITHTTRPKRLGEQDGVDYYFETPASFANNEYLEQVNYAHYRYGSSVVGLLRAWQQSDWVSIVLDGAGALSYQQHYPQNTVIIFLTVDSKELYERLQRRNDDSQALKKRLTSPEFQRDLHLPSTLKATAHVIDNSNWLQTQKQLDLLIKQLKTAEHRTQKRR